MNNTLTYIKIYKQIINIFCYYISFRIAICIYENISRRAFLHLKSHSIAMKLFLSIHIWKNPNLLPKRSFLSPHHGSRKYNSLQPTTKSNLLFYSNPKKLWFLSFSNLVPWWSYIVVKVDFHTTWRKLILIPLHN